MYWTHGSRALSGHFRYSIGTSIHLLLSSSNTTLPMSSKRVMIFSFFNKEFKAIEKEFGGEGTQQKEQDKESLTKQNKDGIGLNME